MTPSAELERLRVRVSPASETRAIIQAVADDCGVSVADIMSDNRAYWVSHPRHEAMYEVFVQRPKLSYPEIGRLFCRDHTSVLHGVRAHCARIGLRYQDVMMMRKRTYWLRAETFNAYAEVMKRAA